jgi:adenylyltransferase/sulfurtransferase
MENRYSRQIKLVGEKKQTLLLKKKVLIVGAGGLGSAAAELLLRSGVENIAIIDQDKIELTNLGRQLLYTEKDISKDKAVVAKEKLKEINSKAKIERYNKFLTNKNISLLGKYDLILDCTDNLETRFWINTYCRKNKIPWIYASAIRWEGYVMLIQPRGPCLSCFLKKGMNETCNQQGIISPLPPSIAALQVTLGIKYFLGEKIDSLLYHLNLNTLELKKIKVKQNPRCVTCCSS